MPTGYLFEVCEINIEEFLKQIVQTSVGMVSILLVKERNSFLEKDPVSQRVQKSQV